MSENTPPSTFDNIVEKKSGRALKCHALSVSLTHFDATSRSHSDKSISRAFELSEVLMNSEFVPSLALNFLLLQDFHPFIYEV